MGTLLGEDGHKLLKWRAWLPIHEVDFDFVAFDEVGSERRIVERVKPVPAFATNVVVGEYPLEAFDVALTDARLELFVLFGSLDMEFCRVIAILVAIFT